MKRSRFTEEQIAYALRQAEAGTPAGDVCRQLGVSEASFYVWKKKFAGLGVTELRKLRMLEEEDARLKPARRRELAHWIREHLRRVCSRRAGWHCCGARPGIGVAGRRTRRRCVCAFANWRLTGRASAICASTCYCGVRVG